ncbi:MAG: 4'-phosphopantetheinyl transferase superfamily protein [Deltaproteobacteria bacterium]|nr:4'-phosphopantetheinyl transferase superfamily protein [Deltaproteobacteria bacterium]
MAGPPDIYLSSLPSLLGPPSPAGAAPDVARLATPAVLALIPRSRRQKALRIRPPGDRARSLAASLMLREVLDVRDDDDLVFGPAGRPGLSPKKLRDLGADRLSFSLSHSGDWVALAVGGPAPLGVDVEKRRREPVPPALMKRTLSPEELLALPEPGPFAFIRVWTLKEALAKALGLGLTLPLDSFSVWPPSAGVVRILSRDWRLRSYLLDPDPGPAAPDSAGNAADVAEGGIVELGSSGTAARAEPGGTCLSLAVQVPDGGGGDHDGGEDNDENAAPAFVRLDGRLKKLLAEAG